MITTLVSTLRSVGAAHVLTVLVPALLLVTASLRAQEPLPEIDPAGEVRRAESIYRKGMEDPTGEMTGENVEGRQEWFYFQRRFPYDRIPAGALAEGVARARAMESTLGNVLRKSELGKLLARSRWESIGPVNQGGRVRGLAAVPGEPGAVLIGAAAGGVWKTPDEGATWTTTFDTMPALAIGAIAIDFSDPRVIYVGTGENTANIDAYLGDGIFKSTDGGVTWRSSGLTNVASFSKLFVHRQNPSVVYAAAAKANGGFYRSSDAGTTWRRITLPGAGTSTIYDMSVDPGNSSRLFISTPAAVYRSTDAGESFAQVSGSGSGINVNGAVRISVALAPSSGDRVYILVARTGGANNMHLGDFYSSTNNGATWQLRRTFDEQFFFSQGWYDNCLAVHPTDQNIVLAGGIDVYRTTDGGTTWLNTTRVYQGGDVHPDQHLIQFDPNVDDIAYLGNDGGVYRSLDAGASWEKISTALPITQFYAMDVDQTRPYRVYGGTQDNGTSGSYGTVGFPENWVPILGGDGFHVVVDLTNPNIVYAENYYGQPLYRIDVVNPNARARIDVPISTGTNADAGWWSTPIAMSPVDRTTLYSGRRYLWRTRSPRTGASEWERLDPLIGAASKITTIGLSYTDASRMAIGTHVGEFRYSVDGGATWRSSGTSLPGRYVTKVEYDPVTSGRLWVAFSGFGSGHVYRSDDDGATFANVTANLPDVPVNAIAIDPADNQVVFVGTDAGVFVTMNGGGTWLPFNDGLPRSPVADLRIHRSTRSLIAATHGRSMFRVVIDELEPQPLLVSPAGGENVPTPGTLLVRWAGLTGPVRVLLSLEEGAPFVVVADNVSDDQATIDLPLARSTGARIRVEEIGTGRVLTSEPFTLTPTPTVSTVGTRGFVAGAVAVRGGWLWAAVRGNDSLYKLRLPVLSGREGLTRSGFTGEIVDLDYDARFDLFYALTNDGGAWHVHRMDTTGAARGEVPIPAGLGELDGIAVTPEGLALVTAGADGRIVVIDPTTGAVLSESPIAGAVAVERRGLVWNNVGYVQSATDRVPGALFHNELLQFTLGDTAKLVDIVPVVVAQGEPASFYGLTFDPSNPVAADRYYYATDDAGIFYRFRAVVVSEVADEWRETGARRSHAIASVRPNPLRDGAEITIRSAVAGRISIDLLTETGERALHVFAGEAEPGEERLTLNASALASGVYYLTLTAANGERDVMPVVVVR